MSVLLDLLQKKYKDKKRMFQKNFDPVKGSFVLTGISEKYRMIKKQCQY